MKKIAIFAAMVMLVLSSCTTMNRSMRETSTRLELTRNDFNVSEQFTAEAKSTTIIGIDFDRLFLKETGIVEGRSEMYGISLASVPVLGNILSDRTSSYALYQLMTEHQGFDVVFYPQYETKVVKPILGIGFFTKITTVKVTSRLGKFKAN